jgi:glutaminyl-peptide cyclotransferase
MTKPIATLPHLSWLPILAHLLLIHPSSIHCYGQERYPSNFCSDSAYYFIQRQIEIGSRVPNTQAHQTCKKYLKETLKKFGAQLSVQKFKTKAFDGTVLQLYNLIASFNPIATKRLLLAAHWDTRPFADKDKNQTQKPIQGANDGASGVGILLEIARLTNQHPLQQIGIDIILFDGEDYGVPADHSTTPAQRNTFWCLGSQFWCKYPHTSNYQAKYGILLDMVGHPQATFYKEGWSEHYAPKQVKIIWRTAARLGHKNYFINRPSHNYITDDHYFINKYRNIPTVNIIDHSHSEEGCFKPYHHTHMDTIDHIDKRTLQAVGETVLQLIYDFENAQKH